MNRSFFFLPLVFGMFLMSSCNHFNNPDEISSGIIKYRIRYLNDNLEDNEEAVLPKTMELVFNKDMAANYIDGFLGLYRLNSITKFDTRKCVTWLKVFDKHYIYKGKKGEYMCCFDGMEDMEIEETEETKIISGLLCRRAIVSLPCTDETFDIYYTNDIDLRHPNLNNPYKNIDGVLIQFELRLLHLKMEFCAENFEPVYDKDAELLIPKNTVEISRDQMTQLLNRLLE